MTDSQLQIASHGVNRFVVAIVFAVVTSSVLSGQQLPQDFTAPPPVKVISSQERAQLNESRDAKARVKLSILLAEAHLAKAEAQTAEHVYDNALGETARYWAIIENAFAHLRTIPSKGNKMRDLYKRLELALRSHGPRLSNLRRNTPAEYGVWIKEIEEYARKGRTEALNSFYGETVVRDSHRAPAELTPAAKPLQENPAVPRPTP